MDDSDEKYRIENSVTEDSVFEKLMTIIRDYYSARREGRFLDYKHPEDLARILDLDKPDENGDWNEIFNWVEKYLAYSLKTHHPSFVNRMWVGANLPSIVGEIVTAVTNTSACTYESAPVSTLMEKYMISTMLELVGFVNGEGQMTTGSSNANMIAMMAARNSCVNRVKFDGLSGQRKLFGFVGADAHYSMDKAANILGIGINQLVKIPLNDRGEMEITELERRLDAVMVEDGIPFFVAATAGTTVRGAYDPIEPLLQLRDRYHFWLHVDGAWGGAAVMSEKLRKQYLSGLESADSFTWDFHKMLGAALMCNILLINNRSHTFGTVLAAGDGSYLFRDEHENEVEDLGTVSLQCGRRVDSLKWFLDWKFFGRKGFEKRIENYLELCEYAEQWIENSSDLELVVPRTSFNVCFRFKVDPTRNNSFNLELRTRLYRQGRSLVGIAYIDGNLVLRLLITNSASDRQDIDLFFATLVETGQSILQEGWHEKR